MFFKVYFIVLYPKQIMVIKIEISIFIKNNVKELILTTEGLEKTTTQKVKRFKEIEKILSIKH